MSSSNIKIVEQPRQPLSMNPKQFGLWLFMLSVIMIFGALTSAYIVRQAEGNWMFFELPVEMYYTTGLLLLSSVTMHWAFLAAKNDALDQVKLAISLTTGMGILFLLGQLYIWSVLVDMSVFLVGNPSGSFLYILMGLHGLHLVSGVIFLIIVLISTFKYKVHSKNLSQIRMCTTYWHFLDFLWVYLVLFLLLNN